MEEHHLGRKDVGQRESVAPGSFGDRGQISRPQDRGQGPGYSGAPSQ
jgi:hypothetical protein